VALRGRKLTPCSLSSHFLPYKHHYLNIAFDIVTIQTISQNGRTTALADPVQQGRWTGAYMDVSTACLSCS